MQIGGRLLEQRHGTVITLNHTITALYTLNLKSVHTAQRVNINGSVLRQQLVDLGHCRLGRRRARFQHFLLQLRHGQIRPPRSSFKLDPEFPHLLNEGRLCIRFAFDCYVHTLHCLVEILASRFNPSLPNVEVDVRFPQTERLCTIRKL